MSCNTDPCPEGRPSPCEVKCPQPIVTSTNEACVVSCGDSRVIIYPPPVIVTFPGPILSTCPQESLVGAAVPCESGVSQSATTVPLTSEIGGNSGFSVPLRSEIGGNSGFSVPLRSEIMGNSGCSAERLYLNREPEQPSTYTYSFTSQWRHPCNRPGWNRYRSFYMKKEEPEEEEKPKEWHVGTEESS